MALLSRYKTQAQKDRSVRRLQVIARFLDYAFYVPLLNRRVGWDAVIGMIPVVGDAVTAGAALWIILEGYRLGASFKVIVQMLANAGVDFVGGSVPLAGDVFDLLFQANRRNLILLGIDVSVPGDRPSSSPARDVVDQPSIALPPPGVATGSARPPSQDGQ